MWLTMRAMSSLVAAWGILSKANAHCNIADCLDAAGVPFSLPNTTAFAADVAPFNLRLRYTPAALALPTSIPHIQAAVRCAVQLGLKVTPKGGGHNYASFGLGGEDGHLVVQLDRMYNVTLGKDNVATIQAGARLGHVATELYAQGKRAISHGTCPGVGISGHILHGGFGMSSHTHGLALDWLESATVVLANSSIVTCSESEHQELFWALRGAGSSFGIAAEYTFKTYPAPEEVVWFTTTEFPLSYENTTDALLYIQEYTEKDMPVELNMRLFVHKDITFFEGLYYGTVEQAREVMKPIFEEFGTDFAEWNTTWLSQLEHYSYGDALNPTYPYNNHDTFYASSLTTTALKKEQFQHFVDYWYTTGFENNRLWYFQMDMHGGASSAVETMTPHSATAYAHRDKLFLFQFYDRPFAGPFPLNGFSFLQDFIATLTDGRPEREWGRYANYADSQLTRKEALKQYYRGNLARLRKLKKRLDPREVFYYPQSVNPAK